MGKQHKIIKVGTFNLLNLALAGRTFYGHQSYNPEEYARKQQWIRQQLTKMDADIIGFQELFDEQALKDLISDFPAYKAAHICVSQKKGGGPAVALLSKYPIVASTVYTHFPDKLDIDGLEVPFEQFSRPVLSATIQVKKDLQLQVFVAHLKSKRPLVPAGIDRHDPREQAKGSARSLLLRACESNALRSIMLDSLEKTNLPHIALGDFNDTHTAVTTQIISGQAPPRNWPNKHKRKAWDIVLYHAKDIQARQSERDTYYTHIHNGHYESLDHILVSQELVRENPNHVGKIVYVRVFNDHLIDATFSDSPVKCWQSDHAQVVALIEWRN